jgi:hypothetical protein
MLPNGAKNCWQAAEEAVILGGSRFTNNVVIDEPVEPG